MTYDQAQSPRLGQRTAIESTYVQIVDVTPGNELADLPEAAYPGQLIYRNDLSILQIWDENADPPTWRDVAGGGGGTEGQFTYVGPEEPVGEFNEGDVWFDSDDQYRPHLWIPEPAPGSWVPSANIRTYYEPGYRLIDPENPDSGYVPDLVDPTLPLWYPLTTEVAGVGEFAVGDLWYQTDDSSHPYRWNGTLWLDLEDPALNVIPINTDAIIRLDQIVENLGLVAYSANNTADTADGRVSMSDYLPGNDDITYTQIKTQIDPDTGEQIQVEVQVPRVNGSIWFTRTRPRYNLCTNPSFETNTDGWTQYQATSARFPTVNVPAGLWTLEVTNSSAAGNHWVAWSELTRQSCTEGQVYSASIFAELISGSGVGATLEIVWYDAAGILPPSVSEPYNLIQNAFDPAVAGTIAEPRIWVVGVAPPGAVSFYVRVNNPNPSDVWHTGAMLLEQEDDLGRYFDGDSYDGFWDDVPHASTSYLQGDKITAIFELRDENWIRKYLTAGALESIEASKLVGTMDGTILKPGTVTADRLVTSSATSSDILKQGDIVHVWNEFVAGVGTTYKVRRACASINNPLEAHGFVLDDAAVGDLVKVYHAGGNPYQANLAPGNQWLGLQFGKVTNQPPSSIGQTVQRIGYAPNPTTLEFQPGPAIRLT